MPHIAFILEAFYGDQIGGAERQVQIIAQALRREGWKTTYIAQRDSDKPARENLDGMDVIALPQHKRRSAWFNYTRLREAMKASRADIFYQRIRHPYSGLTARICRSLKKPFIFAAASTADVIKDTDLRNSGHAGNPLDRLLHPLDRMIEDRGILKADVVILQTEEQLQLLKEQYGRDGIVIPNSIVVNDELDSAIEKKEPPEIFWISNIKQFKRPEIFIELAGRCADLPVNFVMAGGCPNQSILKDVEKAEKEIQKFSYIGPIDPVDAAKRIAGSMLLINTSDFEGFPNAFQQAWARGVPTLSMGVDPDDVIKREQLGGCAASVDDLEAITRRFHHDQNMREEVGERARIFACEHYNVRVLLPQYCSLFEKLIDR